MELKKWNWRTLWLLTGLVFIGHKTAHVKLWTNPQLLLKIPRFILTISILNCFFKERFFLVSKHLFVVLLKKIELYSAHPLGSCHDERAKQGQRGGVTGQEINKQQPGLIFPLKPEGAWQIFVSIFVLPHCLILLIGFWIGAFIFYQPQNNHKFKFRNFIPIGELPTLRWTDLGKVLGQEKLPSGSSFRRQKTHECTPVCRSHHLPPLSPAKRWRKRPSWRTLTPG